MTNETNILANKEYCRQYINKLENKAKEYEEAITSLKKSESMYKVKADTYKDVATDLERTVNDLTLDLEKRDAKIKELKDYIEELRQNIDALTQIIVGQFNIIDNYEKLTAEYADEIARQNQTMDTMARIASGRC